VEKAHFLSIIYLMLSPSRCRNENMMKFDMNRCLREFEKTIMGKDRNVPICLEREIFRDASTSEILSRHSTLFAIEHSCKLIF